MSLCRVQPSRHVNCETIEILREVSLQEGVTPYDLWCLWLSFLWRPWLWEICCMLATVTCLNCRKQSLVHASTIEFGRLWVHQQWVDRLFARHSWNDELISSSFTFWSIMWPLYMVWSQSVHGWTWHYMRFGHGGVCWVGDCRETSRTCYDGRFYRKKQHHDTIWLYII